MTLTDAEKIRRFDAGLGIFKDLKIRLNKFTTHNNDEDPHDRREKVAAAMLLVTTINEIRKCLGITDEEEELINQELRITR